MDESTYSGLVAAAFQRIVTALDDVDPDVLDVVATSDMITVTDVRSGEKVIVNTQRAVWQLWVAGRGQGIHFTFGDGRWLDDKARGFELFTWVGECVGAMSGLSLKL